MEPKQNYDLYSRLDDVSHNPLLLFNIKEREGVSTDLHNLNDEDKIKLTGYIDKFIRDNYTFIDRAEKKEPVIKNLEDLKNIVVSLEVPEESKKLSDKLDRILNRLTLVPGPINRMPNDVLILSFLKAVDDVKDFNQLRLVCKKFKACVENPQVIRLLFEAGVSSLNLPTLKALWILDQFGGKNLGVNISYCDDLSTEVFDKLKQMAPKITSLRLEGETMAPSEFVVKSVTIPVEQFLNMTTELVAQCSNLKSFELDWCGRDLTLEEFTKVIHALPQNLEEITVRHVDPENRGLTLPFAKVLTDRFQNLKFLSFGWPLTSDDKDKLMILKGLLQKDNSAEPRYPELKVLNFDNPHISPTYIKLISTSCPNLESFTLFGQLFDEGEAKYLTDEEVLEYISGFSKLENLLLEDCDLKDETYDAIVANLKKLKSISFSGGGPSDKKIKEVEAQGIEVIEELMPG